MTLAPFFAAPIVIKAHLLAALLVLAMTPFQFFLTRKGSPAHRATGYIWLSAMGVVALSSFGISAVVGPNIAGFGLIHLLSLLSLFSIVQIIRHARAHRMREHRGYVIGLTLGFLIAGAFTLAPGRIMGRIFWG